LTAACYGEEECLKTAVCAGDETCEETLSTNLGSDTETEERKKRLRTSKVLDELPVRSGITMFGLETIDSSWPAYCDHYHLYSFGYDSVTPASESDLSTDLSVWGWSMIGFPGLCTYTDWLAISTPVVAGSIWATTGD
jgi:hypothetical protein